MKNHCRDDQSDFYKQLNIVKLLEGVEEKSKKTDRKSLSEKWLGKIILETYNKIIEG